VKGFDLLTTYKPLPAQIESKDYLSFSGGLIYLPGDSVLSSDHEDAVWQGLLHTFNPLLQKQRIIFWPGFLRH